MTPGATEDLLARAMDTIETAQATIAANKVSNAWKTIAQVAIGLIIGAGLQWAVTPRALTQADIPAIAAVVEVQLQPKFDAMHSDVGEVRTNIGVQKGRLDVISPGSSKP